MRLERNTCTPVDPATDLPAEATEPIVPLPADLDLSRGEAMAEEFDREYEPLDVLMFGHPLTLKEAVGRAWRIIHACAPPEGPVDGDLFVEIWENCYHDLALWLRCLPQILAHREEFGEAIDLCERLAPIFDARAFLADRAILLAQAGRFEEARTQVRANVRAWPKDSLVLKKSCETLWAMGRAEEALVLYDEVLEILSRRQTGEEKSPCPRPAAT
jgi:tetratricopeptide (TPR) repeat protein